LEIKQRPLRKCALHLQLFLHEIILSLERNGADLDKKVVNILELIQNEEITIQLGYDKNGTPVYLNDVIVEEVEQLFSDDYWNGYESRAKYSPPSEPKLYKGKVYRKVQFRGSSFILNRIKEEGHLPKGTVGEEWATQSNLSRYTKVSE
jgi:hypothetical protein